RHSFRTESLLEGYAALPTVDLRNMLDSRRHLVETFADESRNFVLNDFRNGPTPIGQHRRSAGQLFNQHKTKRLRPVVGADECHGIPKEFVLFCVRDLTEILD